MKKFLFLAGITIAFIACSKNNDDEGNPAPPKESSFSASIKEAFTDPYKDLKNILVDDYIPYEITIEDNSSSTEGISYSLISERDEEKHQVFNRDFELYTDNEKGEKQKVTTNYLSFSSKGKHKFYIKPIVPGTFQHTYLLQRQINGKPEGQEQAYHINFNAVKITISATRKFFTYISAKIKIKIEDGINVKDRYLSPEKATQTYSILYNEKTYQGEKQGETIVFSLPSIAIETISEFHIIQQYPNQEPYEIIYYNINFKTTIV
jgi:hypothetical protein